MGKFLIISLMVLCCGGCVSASLDVDDAATENLIKPVTLLEYLQHKTDTAPEFAQALPLMGFDAAAEAGFWGAGVPVLVIDFFGGRETWGPEHGWAVLETLMAVAPQAQYWRLDIDEIYARIGTDQREPSDPVLRALQQAVNYWSFHRRGVINLSFGYLKDGEGCAISSNYHFAIVMAIETLAKRNINIVASAGNLGGDMPIYPACLPEVMAVGSVYDEDQSEVVWEADNHLAFPGCVDLPATRGDLTCFSNRGDIYAVGAFADGFERWKGKQPFTGTSLAAPLVSGALALMQQAGLDAKTAAQRLLDTAQIHQHNDYIYRVLDVSNALDFDEN